MRIATASVRTGFAMTPFDMVQIRGRFVKRPYGETVTWCKSTGRRGVGPYGETGADQIVKTGGSPP